MRMCECVTSKLNIEVKSGWSGRGQYAGACVSSKELHRKKEGESIAMLTFGRGAGYWLDVSTLLEAPVESCLALMGSISISRVEGD